MKICILGRQPEIGLAELEALYGAESVRPAGDSCALVDVDADVDFARLGGSVKAAKLLATLSDSSRKAVFKTIAKVLPAVLKTLPAEGKIKLGLSVYGFDISPYELGGEALRLKKIVRAAGRSVRVVPNESPALSSAQTFHNSLAGELGMEFVIVRDGAEIHIGRVTDVQNIDAYRIRDRGRPKRDAFVGMLPPKLAQVIVNLAVGKLDLRAKTSDLRKPQEQLVTTSQVSGLRSQVCILDPFCGTGVILQEALLMDYDVYGSDKSAKMIDYSKANLEWLLDDGRWTIDDRNVVLEVADATTHAWDFSKIQNPKSKIFVASETYLGQPLGGQSPTKEKFAEIVHETNTVVKGFFANIAPQLEPETRLCVAVPVWFYNGTTHLPVIDELASMGFMYHTFSHAVTPLMYHRENQITGRELLVLTKEHHEEKAQTSPSP